MTQRSILNNERNNYQDIESFVLGLGDQKPMEKKRWWFGPYQDRSPQTTPAPLKEVSPLEEMANRMFTAYNLPSEQEVVETPILQQHPQVQSLSITNCANMITSKMIMPLNYQITVLISYQFCID